MVDIHPESGGTDMKLEFDGNTLYKTGDTISLELRDGSSLVLTDNGMFTAQELEEASRIGAPITDVSRETMTNDLGLEGVNLAEMTEAQLLGLQIIHPKNIALFEELCKRAVKAANAYVSRETIAPEVREEADEIVGEVFRDVGADDRLVVLKPIDLQDLESGRKYRAAREWWTSRGLDLFPTSFEEFFNLYSDLQTENAKLESILNTYREQAETDYQRLEEKGKKILELDGALAKLNNDAELGRAYRTAHEDAVRNTTGYVPRDPEIVFRNLADLRQDLHNRNQQLAALVKAPGSKEPVGEEEAPDPVASSALPPETVAAITRAGRTVADVIDRIYLKPAGKPDDSDQEQKLEETRRRIEGLAKESRQQTRGERPEERIAEIEKTFGLEGAPTENDVASPARFAPTHYRDGEGKWRRLTDQVMPDLEVREKTSPSVDHDEPNDV
jgi:ElaB/YqjD/DUF883 family membrane-anchored ribosome-binding protein